MFRTIAVIGESMAELSQLNLEVGSTSAQGAIGFGGDTLNTAVYLARESIVPSFVTAMGDDALSDWMIGCWKDEGIDCSLVQIVEGEVPGLYMIQTDEDGERSFSYWRKGSPASRLFDDEQAVCTLFSELARFDYLYLSGISVAILNEQARERLITYLIKYRCNGGKLIFDGNYRPILWGCEELTKQVYQQLYEITDIALITLDDEQLLNVGDTKDVIVDRLKGFGISELVLKLGEKGSEVHLEDTFIRVPTTPVVPVDTTSAGDAFNAGYISKRLQGFSAVDAADYGNKVAAEVVQHAGAIVPKSVYKVSK